MLREGAYAMKQQNKLISDGMTEQIITAAAQIVQLEGQGALNVRRILVKLGITNRVFYNRFHNIDEVLRVIYDRTVIKLRESIEASIDPDLDFFEQVKEIVARTLVLSYELKMKFNYYIFESDSVSYDNYSWWKCEIEKIIEYGKEHGHLVPDIKSDEISYAVWCFIRGYNADAIARGLDRERAVEDFKYSFGILLSGMKA